MARDKGGKNEGRTQRPRRCKDCDGSGVDRYGDDCGACGGSGVK